MQEPRCDFLARPGRAGDEHTASGVGHSFQRRANRVDGGGVAGEFGAAPAVVAQPGVLPPQPLGLGRALDQQQQTLRFERLFDEIHRSAADGRNRGIDIAMPGKDDHRQVRFALLDRVEQFKPVHFTAVQPNVEQHEAGSPLVDRGQRAGAVGSGPAFISLINEHAGDEVADIAFVVDYEDFERH